jgi:hypothetical protein
MKTRRIRSFPFLEAIIADDLVKMKLSACLIKRQAMKTLEHRYTSKHLDFVKRDMASFIQGIFITRDEFSILTVSTSESRFWMLWKNISCSYWNLTPIDLSWIICVITVAG